MSKKTLPQLYAEHTGKVSDKWSSYLIEYDRLFADYCQKAISLLEIGIQNGGSLEIWSKYFSNASALIGCDVNPDCARLSYDDSRIEVIIGDANDPDVHKRVCQRSPAFDIIIDDGSHMSKDIIKSFALYFPLIVDGGVFIAEDLHCSYWEQFEGGLHNPYSSLAFFKRLGDIVNYEHWRNNKSRKILLKEFMTRFDVDFLEDDLAGIHSIEFVNSLCIIKKLSPEKNLIGKRIIAGSETCTTAEESNLNATSIQDITIDISDDEYLDVFELTKNVSCLIQAIAECNAGTVYLSQTANEGETQRTDFNQSVQTLTGRRVEKDSVVTDLDGQIVTLSRIIRNLAEQLKKKNAVVIERDQLIKVLTEQMADRDAIATVRDEQIAELNNVTLAYNEALRTIEEIRGSFIWRITAPMCFVSSKIKNIGAILKLLPGIVHFGGGLVGSAKKTWRVFLREGWSGIKRRIVFVGNNRNVYINSKVRPDLFSAEDDRNNYTEWIRRYDTLTDESRAVMRAHIETFPREPVISIVMPVYNPKAQWLIEAIESIRRQIYPYWELCIADDASTEKEIRTILENYAKEDPRIKIIFREKNGNISAVSNSALQLATGAWVALLGHDDLLSEHALFWVADAINRNSDVCIIYSDEDKIDNSGRRFDPYFKCDWNMDLFYSHNLTTHLGVYRAELLKEIGGFREDMEEAQDYDLALRCIERILPNQIHHIPRVLYHRRAHGKSTAKSGEVKPDALLAGKTALDEHLQRQGIKAVVDLLDFGMYRIRYALPDPAPLVSLIIPTRNRLQLLQKCVESILKKTTYPDYEILIVDNGSDDPMVLQYFKQLQTDPKIRVVRDSRPFNYSALNNAAVKLARGEIVGLLNNDLEVISPDWLSEMVSHALRPEVGAVGAKLWYPDGSLQHAGVILGLGSSGVAGHAQHRISKHHHGYFYRDGLIQSMSAVTAACLVIQKFIYEEVGGLNEKDLQQDYNDIDFCLRVRESGYRNIWTPYAELYHHESATRGCQNSPEKLKRYVREIQYMKRRWGDILLNDPAYSPNLTLDHQDFSLAWPPRIKSREFL